MLGGPIQPEKTFFFTDYQGTRFQSGVVRTSTVPTSLQRQGLFSTPIMDPASGKTFSGNQVPEDRWEAARRLLIEADLGHWMVAP